jgi:uncharacterized membrane protein
MVFVSIALRLAIFPKSIYAFPYKYVYTATRQVVNSFRQLQEVPFKKVVIVEFPKVNMYSLAFVTGKPVDFRGEKKIPLFIPHTRLLK